MPSPPLNITLTREEEILTVHWLHPAQPHGHISKFHIRLNEEEEEVYYVNNSSPTYEYSVKKKTLRIICCKTISNKNFR